MTKEAETRFTWPQARNAKSHQEAEDARNSISSGASADILILKFWPPELWENRFLFISPRLWSFATATLRN